MALFRESVVLKYGLRETIIHPRWAYVIIGESRGRTTSDKGLFLIINHYGSPKGSHRRKLQIEHLSK